MGGTGWSGSMEKSANGYPFRILRTNWTTTLGAIANYVSVVP